MNKTDKMSSYGLYLQTVRVEKGVSIEQVAAETRIRAEILRAIEAEDHRHLPDDVFVKGFLKSFAEAVDADPAETLRRFAARRAAHLPTLLPIEQAATPKGPSWLTLLWISVVMIALVAGTLLVFEVVYRKDAGEAARQPASKEVQTTAVDKTAAPPPSPAEQAAPAVPAMQETMDDVGGAPSTDAGSAKRAATKTSAQEPGGYLLEIVCEEDTWLKVIADDAQASEHLLQPGDTLRLKADTMFNLLIGNAGGVSLQLNGKPVPVPGGSGEVVNLELP